MEVNDLQIPESISADPLQHIFGVLDERRVLAATKIEVETAKATLRTIYAEADAVRRQARATRDTAYRWLICAIIFAILLVGSSMSYAANRVGVGLDANARIARAERAENSALNNTFGAHFDKFKPGWFIDFPSGTTFKTNFTCGSRPCIQILP